MVGKIIEYLSREITFSSIECIEDVAQLIEYLIGSNTADHMIHFLIDLMGNDNELAFRAMVQLTRWSPLNWLTDREFLEILLCGFDSNTLTPPTAQIYSSIMNREMKIDAKLSLYHGLQIQPLFTEILKDC
jgi:hypothetical protein